VIKLTVNATSKKSISLTPLAVVFNCFSEAAWELETAVLKQNKNFSKPP
jgi:hypothetical protein